mmetsp:Transcript_38118/g.61732  ORF Transcript_38118/g.61732 Transcript_38118/m.61732 type:complete len:84 (+) Transcript_38118:779-1030(+)
MRRTGDTGEVVLWASSINMLKTSTAKPLLRKRQRSLVKQQWFVWASLVRHSQGICTTGRIMWPLLPCILYLYHNITHCYLRAH